MTIPTKTFVAKPIGFKCDRRRHSFRHQCTAIEQNDKVVEQQHESTKESSWLEIFQWRMLLIYKMYEKHYYLQKTVLARNMKVPTFEVESIELANPQLSSLMKKKLII